MGSTGDTIEIPIIDIRESNVEAPKQLLAAARDFGFVFIENNEAGISPELISKQFKISEQFFALPTEVKQQVSIASNKAGKNHGWLSQGVEKLDPKRQKRADVKEAFNMALPNSSSGTFDQPLPEPITSNLSTVIAFEKACHNLCQLILTKFALALEIPTDWFTSRHDPTKGSLGSIFRYLYYPAAPTTTSDDDIRAGAHSDYGSITCLFQLPGQPGLEILTPKNEWAAVPLPTPENVPILVNIGDLLEDWTGGLLKSTVHRVVFPKDGGGNDRYSIAYFCHPLDEALLEPVPSRIVREFAEGNNGGKKGVKQGITARDHLMERLAATYSV